MLFLFQGGSIIDKVMVIKDKHVIILKNDKTIIAYHFGQYYGLLQKE
jgi:hypothetical protein